MTRKEFFLTFVAAPFVKPLAKLLPPPVEAIPVAALAPLGNAFDDFMLSESIRIQKAFDEQAKKRGVWSELVAKEKFPSNMGDTLKRI